MEKCACEGNRSCGLLSKLGFAADDEMSLLAGYCVMQFVQKISLERKWRIPFAAFKNNENYDLLQRLIGPALPSQDEVHYNDFNVAYPVVSAMEPIEYLLDVTPNLVTDIEVLHEFLEKTALSKFEVATQIYIIKKMYWDNTIPNVNAYQAYCDYISGQSYLGNLSREQFDMVSDAINHYGMHHTAVSYAKAKQAIDIYSAYGLKAEHQMELYSRVNQFLKNKKMKDIVDPYQYVRACMGIHDDFDSFAHVEEAFNQAANFVGGGKIAPNQFWETLYIKQNKYTNDGIESNYVQSEFCKQSFRDKKVLIINPTPTFVRTYMAKAPILRAEESVIVVPWESLADALDSQYCGSGSQFLPMSALSEIDPTVYDSILIISRNYVVDYCEKIGFWRKLQQHGRKHPTCLILGDDHEIQKLVIFLTSILRDEKEDSLYCIDAIDILPIKAFKAMRGKRLSLVRVVPVMRSANLSEKAAYAKYELLHMSRGNDEQAEVIVQMPDVYYASAGETVFYRNGCVRNIYNHLRILAGGAKERKLALEYLYSEELTVWYTVNIQKDTGLPKVKAYLCEYPNKRQQNGVLPRGGEIKGASKWSTARPLFDVTDWIENEAVFDKRIHPVAKNLIRSKMTEKGNVTLKSYWYLKDELKVPDSTPGGQIVRRYLDQNGDMPIGVVTKGDVEESLRLIVNNNGVTDGSAEAQVITAWIENVFVHATKDGLYEVNPLAGDMRAESDRHSALAAVREALSKKQFTVEEEKELATLLWKKYQDSRNGIFIGLMIRLWTGLPIPQVLALTWEDWVQVPLLGISQLWVSKEIRAASGDFLPLNKVEEYRRVPVMRLLDDVLKEHKQYIEENLPPEEKFRKLPIVTSIGKIWSTQMSNFYAPGTMREHARTVLGEIIDPYVVSLLEGDDVVQTDLNDYHGDIFRSNFDYRVRGDDCKITVAECDFLLGRTQNVTYAKHYLDFNSDLVQFVLYSKLERWCNLYEETQTTSGRKFTDMLDINSRMTKAQRRLTLSVNLTVDQPDDETSQIIIEAENSHGVECSVYVYRDC